MKRYFALAIADCRLSCRQLKWPSDPYVVIKKIRLHFPWLLLLSRKKLLLLPPHAGQKAASNQPVMMMILISGVARICCEEGQSWIVGHGALMANFRAGCSSCSMTNSFVTNAVLIERAVSCWHLHQLISQTTQYLNSWLSDLLQRELKMKLLEVEGVGGSRAPVPHCWRRHWYWCGCCCRER